MNTKIAAESEHSSIVDFPTNRVRILTATDKGKANYADVLERWLFEASL